MKAAKHIDPQEILINSTEGIQLVDAGAGTGKTYAIIRRYQKIIDKGVMPRNILLITFTRNAASKMKEDVISKISGNNVTVTELLEAPVLNFHSLCARILKNHGMNSPSYIGISELLAGNFSIIEDTSYEGKLFGKFFYEFRSNTKEKYENIYLSINDNHHAVLTIIKTLCSRGIFPTDSEWFGAGETLLKGDFENYSKLFDEQNHVPEGKLHPFFRTNVYRILKAVAKDRLYAEFDLNSKLSGISADPAVKEDLFRDDTQEEVINFVRHVYHSYIEFMLRRNVLNFEFVVMFAFLILYNNENVRALNRYSYVMVDEFQDTDEIQFQLLMLLLNSEKGVANLAVVGDWKQGIYSFRNTTIENITMFSKRLDEYKKILNKDKIRIEYDVSEENVNKIAFEYNYRSSQKILDFSRHTLLCQAKEKEDIDKEYIKENFKSLTAARELDDLTEIKFYLADDSEKETGLILQKISELVNDERYKVREFYKDGNVLGERRVRYSDICVLSRTKNFGLKLQKAALEKNIPVNFEGGLELFASRQAVLVLAWLRLIINRKDVKGWVPILEKDGYKFNEICSFLNNLDNRNYGMFRDSYDEFLDELEKKKDNIIFLVQAILDKYGYSDEFGYAITDNIARWNSSELISLSDLIELIDHAASGSFKIEINKTSNAVITQTIHAAKGLEYPVVFMANCNTRIFPDVKNSINDIYYHPVSGMRFRKWFDTRGEFAAVFNNWRSDVLVKMVKEENYDEERRLLYVASTRAKQYLYFTAHNPSEFFTDLAEISGIEETKNYNYRIEIPQGDNGLKPETIKLPAKLKISKKFVSVHSLMKIDEYKKSEDAFMTDTRSVLSKGEALAYGSKVHQLAHKLANGYGIDTEVEVVNKIKNFIKELNANELRSEVDFILPKGNEIIRGTIDLIAFYDDRIEVIDYKTDTNKRYLDKYQIQLGLYKEVIQSLFKDKKVVGKIFFVTLGEVVRSE